MALGDESRNRDCLEESNAGGGGIEEEVSSDAGNTYGFYRMSTLREDVGSVFSYDFDGTEDAVYVVVPSGKEQEAVAAAMDALIWTVKNAIINKSSTVVFLVHAFPETKFIPSPLGRLPVSQVNQEQKEMYMAQERGKRREFLAKFLNMCTASQVKVDTILIETDTEVKAILGLITVLHIRKLVLGTTKVAMRKMKSRKGNGIADQLLQNAPEFCDVKIICEGKEMSELTWDSPWSSPSPSSRSTQSTPKFDPDELKTIGSQCSCFKF